MENIKSKCLSFFGRKMWQSFWKPVQSLYMNVTVIFCVPHVVICVIFPNILNTYWVKMCKMSSNLYFLLFSYFYSYILKDHLKAIYIYLYVSLKYCFAFCLNTTSYCQYTCAVLWKKISFVLTSQKILIVLHQVWSQHQGVVGVEGWLQFIPLWSSAQEDKSPVRVPVLETLFIG